MPRPQLSIKPALKNVFAKCKFYRHRQFVQNLHKLHFLLLSPSSNIFFKCFVTTLRSTPNNFAMEACVSHTSLSCTRTSTLSSPDCRVNVRKSIVLLRICIVFSDIFLPLLLYQPNLPREQLLHHGGFEVAVFF